MTTYSVSFNGVLDAVTGPVSPGTCLVRTASGAKYIQATTVNKGSPPQKTRGMTAFLSTGGKAVQIQYAGEADASVTGIPPLAVADGGRAFIRVNAAAGLERANPVLADDEIVGWCDEFGNALLAFGQIGTTTGILAGDVEGPSSTTMVVGLQGVPIDPTGPTTNQVLAFDGTTWIPTTPSAGAVTLAGDTTGPSGSNTTVAIQGIPISTTDPTTGQTLTFNGTSWAPAAATSSVTLAGDATGPSGSNTVVAIQNIAISATDPTTGQALIATSTSAASWQTITVTMAGDVTGPSGTSVVARANGATIPAAGALTTGNVMQVSGASALTYAPVNLAGGANYVTGVLPVGNLPSLAGDVTGTITANLVTTITGNGSNDVAMASGVDLNYTNGTVRDSAGSYQWTGLGFHSANGTFSHAFLGGYTAGASGLSFGAAADTPAAGTAQIVWSTGQLSLTEATVAMIASAQITANTNLIEFARGNTPVISQNAAIGAVHNMTIEAQSTSGAAVAGANLTLASGAPGAGAANGRIQLRFGATPTGFELADLYNAGSNFVTSLCGPVSGIKMPANTGNGVVYINNATTPPTNDPNNGGIMYVESGSLKYRGTDGTTWVLGSA